MSHFTVLVVGNDAEKELEPFQENNNGDCPKKYMKWYGYNKKEGSEWFKTKKEAIAYSDDKEDVHQDNPNKKWDWYSLGGRWTGFFQLKPNGEGECGSPGLMTKRAEPGMVDSALKKHIDFEAMRKAAEKEAAESYDKIQAAFEGLPILHSWEDVRDKKHPSNIDMARAMYHGQPRVKAFNKLRMGGNPDDYQISREEFIRKAGQSSGVTFAVIYKGQWHERGSMGWFAFVSDEKPGWVDTFNNILDQVGDDELLSVYDCHI